MPAERRVIVRVVKVGGSLLDRPDLGQQLNHYLDAEPAPITVLIIGGGSIVDAIRKLDHIHSLGEEPSHWLSIDALTLTARMLHQLLPGSRLERRFDTVVHVCRDRSVTSSSHPVPTSGSRPAEAPPSPGQPSGQSPGEPNPKPIRIVFDPSTFLRNDEPRRAGISLPHGWHVTSDSIAARVSELLKADELVLLKSVSEPPHATWQDLATRQLVDGYFPQVAKRLPRVLLRKLG